jgi:DNA-binding transcriptional MerR regulator
MRYYEEKNLITPISLENGYRKYNNLSLERVKTIQFYIGLGLSTDQIEDFKFVF